MPATSETRSYNALLSTTLENWAKGVYDTVTSSIFFYYMLKRSKSMIGVDALGERCKFSLRYQNTAADSYSGYDMIPVVPMDGITAAFFNWVQLASTITISGIEKRQNAGEYAMVDLLEAKTDQTMDGIHEKFAKATLQGNGINSATAITTAYTSPVNGSVFVVPLPLLIGHSPTSGTIGSIAANSSTVVDGTTINYWANQQVTSTDTNFASQLKSLTKCYNNCSKGPGGAPDMHLVDQNTAEWYEAALRSQNRFTDYLRADIPFDNVLFRKSPVVWDEFMPNWADTTVTQSTSKGSWLMMNSKFVQMKYDNQTNFITTPFISPENQDVSTAKVLWYGSLGTPNRRKNGVVDDIDTTVTS